MKKHEIENEYLLDLIQAMLGAISDNFRAVWLILKGEELNIFFLLSIESNNDREEIEDIIFEFEALQEKVVNIISTVIISNKDWSTINPKGARIVFLKKQN